MSENNIKILKSIGALILFITSIVVIFIAINSISCVSMPKFIDGEPMQCAEAKQMAYLAAATPKEKITEGIVTESVRSCNAMLRYKECKNDRQVYLDAHPASGDRYADLLSDNIAKGIMDTCLLNLKP